MFDIKETRDKNFTIKLEDNSIIRIDGLNYELYREIYKLGNFMFEKRSDKRKAKRIYKFLTKLMNNNLENRTFKQREIESMVNIEVAMYLIKAYQDHMNETLLLIRGDKKAI